MRLLFLRIHPSRVMKNDKTKKGIAKPRTYIIIYNILEPGFAAANPIMAPMIGPIHGCHPAEKASPIRAVPK